MKSKVISYPDIDTIKLRDDQRVVERCNVEEEIERELGDIKRKYSTAADRKEGERVEVGDAVVINAACDASDAPAKFNRNGIGLNLGKFYYDKNAETEILNHRVGDVFEVKAGESGEWTLKIEILSARYTKYRDLTDEDFQKEGMIEGVEIRNEQEYIEYVKNAIRSAENLNHYYDVVVPDLAAELVSKSEFEIDRAELDEDIRNWYHEVEDLPDLPESEDEDGFIPYVQDMLNSSAETREELTEELMAYYERAFKYNLILLDLAKDEEDPSRESFDQLLEELRAAGFSEEEIAEYDNYERYVRDQKLEAGQLVMLDLIEKQLLN